MRTYPEEPYTITVDSWLEDKPLSHTLSQLNGKEEIHTFLIFWICILMFSFTYIGGCIKKVGLLQYNMKKVNILNLPEYNPNHNGQLFGQVLQLWTATAV
jgi:hypothetical protein